MIPFTRPTYTGEEDALVLDALRGTKLSGDGRYGQRCQGWLANHFPVARALLTPSCTHALELAALLLDIVPGDEVILPSFTFVSTANAFVLRGATAVFVDVRPDTMNLDEALVEAAVTPRTRAIVPVHYAGVACEMDALQEIADRHGLAVVEDAAQALGSRYHGRAAGALGDFGAFSFHDTKNITSGGEGGALLVRDERFAQRAEIIREKGTNRAQFFRGMVDKYSWVDVGSSFLPGELQAACLAAQLDAIDRINDDRIRTCLHYRGALAPLQSQGRIELPRVPDHCRDNGHMFWIKVRDLGERTRLIAHLAERSITAAFHYVPLHSAPAGLRFGRFHGEDRYTTRESERLVRLPLFYGMRPDDADRVVDAISSFFE